MVLLRIMEAAMIAERNGGGLLLLLLTMLQIPTEVACARAAPSSLQEARIGACIEQAAAGRGWLEKTLWGLRDQEAGWIGAEVRNSNGSHDLGPLQVNSFWVPRLASMTGRSTHDVRFWLINDPCFNVQAARWIFLTALNGTGDYWAAVGVYHSPTKWRQRRYVKSVVSHLQRRFGENAFWAKE